MGGDRTPWTRDEERILRDGVAAGKSGRDLHRDLGGRRSPSSIDNAIRRFGLTGVRDAVRRGQPVELPAPSTGDPLAPLVSAAPVDPVEAARQREERRKQLREENDLLKSIAGERSLRAFLEKLARDTAATFPAPPAYRPPPVSRGVAPTTTTVVQLLSDFHAGEVVSGEGTRGFNAYDSDVFRERLARIVDAHLLVKAQRERGGGYRHDELVVPLIGDLISGSIHELERHSDQENVVWSVYDCAMALAEALQRLAAAYPKVRLYATSGNHGRLPDARRVQQKDPTRNWDTVIYLLAREHHRLHERMSWVIPNAYSCAWEVYGWRFLQTHGHDVKSWNAIPWYGLNRLVGNLNALEAGRGTPIHYWLFAHFHNAASLPHATGESVINGSLIGGTEFSINALGRSDRPWQWVLFVHPELGLTTREPLYAAPAIAPARVEAAA